MRAKGGVVVVVGVMFLFACGGGNTQQGEVGGHCYPNGTCDVSLSCVGGFCVAAQVDAGPGDDAGKDAGNDGPSVTCGNGTVDVGEDCDQGAANDAVCDANCHFTCGNGMVDTSVGETCDTSITSGSGKCPATCDDGQSCTTDVLVGSACTATCTGTAITSPINGDGCCPVGANANTDTDCQPVCGNSVKETVETCDTGISTGLGSCPTVCNDNVVCTTDVLVSPGTCQATCTFTAITMPINGDGCCPAGANANNDNDCAPVCGNSVVEAGEQCDDGNTNNTDGCDVACFSSDLTCLSGAAPTTAPSTITLAGTASELTFSGTAPVIQPVPAATVTTCAGNCVGVNQLDVQTTSTVGAFTTSPISTGGVPLDAFLKITKSTYRTTFLYPASPFSADATGLPPLSFTNATFATLVTLLGVTQSASNGTISLAVLDCANTPMRNTANITLTVKQGGVAVTGTTIVDAGSFNASSAGTYFIFNVPPGATEVSASYYGTPLEAHTVTVVAASTTQTYVHPGQLTGGLSLSLSANKPGGNCGQTSSGGAGITSTTITLVRNSDLACEPITLGISAGITQPAGTYTINCTTPVVAPCIESDQTLTAIGVPSDAYTIHVRGKVGSSTCWSNDDSLSVPFGATLSRTLNLAFATAPGC